MAVPSQAIAQRHGLGSGGGGWHGGGQSNHRGYGGGYRRSYGGGYGYGGPVYYGHGGYGGYPYYGYGGYPGYYGYGGHYGYGYHDNDAWIAIGAGILGAMLGAAIAQHPVNHYGYPSQPPPQADAPPEPARGTPRCQDGSPIPVEGYCQGPPPPVQQPAAERG
jgi:hypothetical protein